MKLNKKSRIRWFDPKSAKSKKCPLFPQVKMIDPDGNVVTLALSNGMPQPDDPYAARMRREKKKAGFVVYAACAENKCNDGSDEKACQHTEKLIKALKAKKRKKHDAFMKKFVNHAEELMKQLMKQNPADESK